MKLIKYSTYYDSILFVMRHPVRCFKNFRLTRKYPWLLPHSAWTGKKVDHYHYQSTELDAMLDGWRKAFGKMMMDDLLEACKKDDIDPHRLRVIECKEKWGSLRLTLNEYTPNIQRVIDAYEQVSQNVCCKCGKIDVPITKFGYVIPSCRECFVRDGMTEKYYDNLMSELKEEDIRIPDYYTTHCFNKDGDQYVNSDLTWITNRLRGIHK